VAGEGSRALGGERTRTSAGGPGADASAIGASRRAAGAKKAILAGLPKPTGAGFLAAEEARHAAMALRRDEGRET
jgi:hypothetical protein